MTAQGASVGSAGVDPDEAVRSAILQAAIRCFREHAFNDVTIATVADAAGLDLDAVTAWYPTLNGLIIDTVQLWNGRRTEPLLPIAEQAGAVAFLRAILAANQADPGLMRLLTAMVNLAATPGHPLTPPLQRQWLHFHASVQRTLANDIATRREPAAMEAAAGAEQLIALYEGLQLQSMLRPSMDVLASYDRAVARLRDGWSRPVTPQVWDI